MIGRNLSKLVQHDIYYKLGFHHLHSILGNHHKQDILEAHGNRQDNLLYIWNILIHSFIFLSFWNMISFQRYEYKIYIWMENLHKH